MKKTVWIFLVVIIIGTFLSSLHAQSQLSDRINLSREGGTTRSQRMMTRSAEASTVQPEVDASVSKNAVAISVQNYNGSVLVQIIGPREVKQNYIEVSDSRTESVNINGLRAGQYTIRITVGTDVYVGKFKKAAYGR